METYFASSLGLLRTKLGTGLEMGISCNSAYLASRPPKHDDPTDVGAA